MNPTHEKAAPRIATRDTADETRRGEDSGLKQSFQLKSTTRPDLAQRREKVFSAITIPRCWHALGLNGEPGKTCRTPWREDRSPSFSIYDESSKWKDHATGEGGNVIDFVMRATGRDFLPALEWLEGLAGIQLPPHSASAKQPAPTDDKPRRLNLPLTGEGIADDWKAVASSRKIRPYAVEVGVRIGCILFGDVCGFDCWILTDRARKCAEARRIDGKPFPAIGKLGERKAHTLAGSAKSWPVGLEIDRDFQDNRSGLLLVEGGPDFLAALHFRITRRKSATGNGKGFRPVAMLGRGNHIHPEALPHFKGREVRIYPHADKDGGGMEAAKRWAKQITQAQAASVEIFPFDGLKMASGRDVSDLNDATSICPEQINELEGLLP